MAKQSKTQYVLLGLLVDGPKSGYDMKKTIELSIGHFWSESYGQIYPVLKKLHQEKLIEKKAVQQANKPEKKIYSITKSGKKHFKQWLASGLEKTPERNEMLLRTFFGGHSSPGVMIEMLKSLQTESLRMKSFFSDIEKNVQEHCADSDGIENSAYSMLTLRYGIMSFEMQAKWAKESIAFLERSTADQKNKNSNQRKKK